MLILSYGIFLVPERDYVLLSESCMKPTKIVHDVIEPNTINLISEWKPSNEVHDEIKLVCVGEI